MQIAGHQGPKLLQAPAFWTQVRSQPAQWVGTLAQHRRSAGGPRADRWKGGDSNVRGTLTSSPWRNLSDAAGTMLHLCTSGDSVRLLCTMWHAATWLAMHWLGLRVDELPN